MSNGLQHRQVAALTLGAAHIIEQARDGQLTGTPIATALAGYAFGTLPDILEPPTHPGHRASLHSYAALALVGVVAWKLYQWRPDKACDRYFRWLGLAALGAYCVHLAMDSRTPAGLPIL